MYNDMIVTHRNTQDLRLRVLGYTWEYDREAKQRAYTPHFPTQEHWNIVIDQFKKDVMQQLWKGAGFQEARKNFYGQSLLPEHTATYMIDRIVAGHEMYRTKRNQGDKKVRRPHRTKRADEFHSVRYTLGRGATYQTLSKGWGELRFTHRGRTLCTVPVRTHDQKERPLFIENTSTMTLYRARRGKVVHDENGNFISESGGEWYAIFATRKPVDDEIVHPYRDRAIGIDMGLAYLYMGWNGDQAQPYAAVDFYDRVHRKRKRLQRRINKGKKDTDGYLLSNAFQTQYWRDTKRQIAKLEAEVARQRDYDLHVATSRITDDYGIIILEDITPQFMIANKHLARRAANAAWAKFKQMLTYKAEEKGCTIVYVNPAYTSQTCSVCGCINKENRVSQSRFVCQDCGYTDNADVNAAKNIRTKGLELISLNAEVWVGSEALGENEARLEQALSKSNSHHWISQR
jgi:IS605 OrfB family transposase